MSASAPIGAVRAAHLLIGLRLRRLRNRYNAGFGAFGRRKPASEDGGLRRTLGLTASVLASAAIFAVVHPPFSVIPVFGLGVAAALVYERTRLLVGAAAAHAVYNALVVGYQFLP